MDKLEIKKLAVLGLLLVIVVTGLITAGGISQLAESSPAVVAVPEMPVLAVRPATVIQGDPIMLSVLGTGTDGKMSNVKKITFASTSLAFSEYDGNPTAFVAIDLNKKPGKYSAQVILADGTVLNKTIVVNARKKNEAPLGVPASLGGNTLAAETNVVDSLATDNEILAQLKSATTSYWTKAFEYPIENPIVTDIYGYTRQTGPYEIAHKGTDFKAPPGTSVYAINDGKVILAQNFGLYGNTIVVDHGQGIMSFYMHLSEINVAKGERVNRGEFIGKSGETGYAEGPHLHLTVRVQGISIDPMEFFKFFVIN